jgi:hypothetical protein
MKLALFCTPLACLYLLHFGWAGLTVAAVICAVTGGVARAHRYGFQWVGWCWAMTVFFAAGALINL